MCNYTLEICKSTGRVIISCLLALNVVHFSWDIRKYSTCSIKMAVRLKAKTLFIELAMSPISHACIYYILHRVAFLNNK